MLSRSLSKEDIPFLDFTLEGDTEHPGLKSSFFQQEGTLTNVYEEEGYGPVCYVRGCAVLRLDIHYCNNQDARRNMKTMLEGFPLLAQKARDNGFSEVVFQSDSPLLRSFCIKRLGFVESAGEMRKVL